MGGEKAFKSREFIPRYRFQATDTESLRQLGLRSIAGRLNGARLCWIRRGGEIRMGGESTIRLALHRWPFKRREALLDSTGRRNPDGRRIGILQSHTTSAAQPS